MIFKIGVEAKGIKAAAAIWIAGALGLALATTFWWIGVTFGLVTSAVIFCRHRKRLIPTRTRRNERSSRLTLSE